MLQTLIISKTRLRLVMKIFIKSNISYWFTGSFARGLNSSTIDNILIGDDIDQIYLAHLVEKVKKLISRKVQYTIIPLPEKVSCLLLHPEAFRLWEDVE